MFRGGITKTVEISQLPNFPPVFGRYTSGSVLISSFINQTRFRVEDGIFTIEFAGINGTYTYSMGFAVINDETIIKSIASHLSITFNGTLTSDIYKTPIRDSNFVVIGHVFPAERKSHIIEYLWDGILFFKYIVTYT